jgi:hypothetical protein
MSELAKGQLNYFPLQKMMFAVSTLIIVEKRRLSSCVCTSKTNEENIGQVIFVIKLMGC